MRAARQEGQRWESLAVALQGKRPQPPTPSPASKATLGQEGPSKAATIEDDSSETNESESEGDSRTVTLETQLGSGPGEQGRTAGAGRHSGAREKQSN